MAVAKLALTSSAMAWALFLRSAFRMKYQNSEDRDKKTETTYRCSGDQCGLEREGCSLQVLQTLKDERGGINDNEDSSKFGLLLDDRLESVEDGRRQGAAHITNNLWDL
jgi:hypothetical protein